MTQVSAAAAFPGAAARSSNTETLLAGNRTLHIVYGGYSAQGPKDENQDAFAACLPKGSAAQFKGAAACIADGASYCDHAKLASQTSVTDFISDYFSTPETWSAKTAAARVLSALNTWLFHHGQHGGPRGGLVTTFSALIIKSNTAHLFQVGDSRIYRYRQQSLQQLTQDHRQQQGNRSYLMRALGMENHLKVDYLEHSVQVGDIFVLTTDGVHDFIVNSAISERLDAIANNGDTAALESCARSIIQQALDNGGNDNASCLLLRVETLPDVDVLETHRQLQRLAILPPLEIGMQVDGYRVTRVLMQSTRSSLYVVKDADGHPYVLKAAAENYRDDAGYLESFVREQWVGRRINHPNIMKILPPTADSAFLYHICEYIDGQSLRQWIYDNPKPSLEKARDIIKRIIPALRAFQRAGMVHRDIKPENIMLTEDGQIKLIDFGATQVNGLQDMLPLLPDDCPRGDADYIAPEYLLSGKAVETSDLFSLGIIFYEMLTQKLPYQFANLRYLTPKHYGEWRYRSIRRRRPDLPEWIDRAIEKAVYPNPRSRYAAFSEFEADILVPNPAFASAAQPLLERNPVLFWQLLSLALLAIIVLQWCFLGT